MQTQAPNLPDQELLRRYVEARDESAFSAIVQRHAGLVYATCLRMLGDATLAEEQSQETFFKLVKQCGVVRDCLPGWLHRTATTTCLDLLRKEGRRRTHHTEYRQTQPVGDTATPACEDAGWREVAGLVDEAMLDLPPAQREVLIGHFMQGRTLRDLSAAHGVSVATMHRRVQQALDAVRNWLKRMGVAASAVALTVCWNQTAAAAPATLHAALGKMSIVSGMTTAAVPAASLTPVSLVGKLSLFAVTDVGRWVTILVIGGAGLLGSIALVLMIHWVLGDRAHWTKQMPPPRPTIEQQIQQIEQAGAPGHE